MQAHTTLAAYRTLFADIINDYYPFRHGRFDDPTPTQLGKIRLAEELLSDLCQPIVPVVVPTPPPEREVFISRWFHPSNKV